MPASLPPLVLSCLKVFSARENQDRIASSTTMPGPSIQSTRSAGAHLYSAIYENTVVSAQISLEMWLVSYLTVQVTRLDMGNNE